MKKRLDLEIMRIVAIIFVIVNHTATNQYVSADIYNSGIAYYFYLFIAALARVAVPIFFMVSGALLLGKNESIVVVFKKRVLKYIVLILGFSGIQYLYFLAMGYASFSRESIVSWLKNLYSDSVIVPYWFLYAYLGLMIMLPFLRKIAQNLSEMEFQYLIVLHFILFGVFQIVEFAIGLERINLEIPFACNTAIFYFLIGYYLDNYTKKIEKRGWTVLSALSLVSVGLLTFMAYRTISVNGVFADGTKYQFSSALIIFPTVTIFLFLKRMFCDKSEIKMKVWVNRLIVHLGGAVFGVYLLESIFDAVTFDVYFLALKFVPPISAWLIWVFVDAAFGLFVIVMLKMIETKLRRKRH